MWNCLPNELQVKILGYIDSKAHLAKCRLVCRAWCPQATALLLGQHIVLRSNSDVSQLYMFLCRDPVRGSLIKHLTLLGPCFNRYLLSQLVHLVFTPTLEKFEGRLEGCGSDACCGADFWSEINCKALNDASSFDRLTVLPSHPEFTLMYFNTLSKFKKTLQSMTLYLTELSHRLEEQYVMERLHGFEALVMLDLKIKINDVTDIEQVLQHFHHLKQLEIELDEGYTFIMSEKRLLEWTTINAITVVEKLDVLQIRGCFFGDVLEYFCYKYPNVNAIKIDDSTMLMPTQDLNNVTKEQLTIQLMRMEKSLKSKFSLGSKYYDACRNLDVLQFKRIKPQ